MATCYRHPNTETGVSCSSCGRPICPDCMTATPVGMRCPECARQKTKVRDAASIRASSTSAPVTKAIIAACVIAYVAELATGSGGLNGVGGSVVDQGALLGRGLIATGGHLELAGVAEGQWWRLITGAFLHASVFHILFNMYLLWILGQMLEPAIGSVRFAIVYFVSLLAGAFGALALEPQTFTVGASGAIFGLMGFAFVELRSRGINPFQTWVGWLIIINLILGLVLNNVSIGGHVGGLIGGALVGFAFQAADRERRPAIAYAGAVLVAVASVVAAVAVSGSAGLGSPHI